MVPNIRKELIPQMAKTAYGSDFKDLVLADMKANRLSVHGAAKKHQINHNTIYNWLRNEDPQLKAALKEIRELKAENKVMLQLIKKLSVDFKKKS